MFTRPIFIIKRDYIKEKLHPLMWISKTLKVKKKKKREERKKRLDPTKINQFMKVIGLKLQIMVI